jgi:RimJ/RimL family protein N-acetyltransferase
MHSLADSLLPREFPAGCLRRLRRSDLDAFQAYRSIPELGRYPGWSPMSEAEALAFLVKMEATPLFEPGQWVQLGIAESHRDSLVGDIGLRLSDDSQTGEVGFTLSPSAQGRGVASGAVQEAVQLLFTATPVAQIRGITDARNAPSVRLLERLGFECRETRNAVFRGAKCRQQIFVLPRVKANQGTWPGNVAALLPGETHTQPRRATLDDMASVAALHRLAFFHAMPHMPVLHTPDEDLAFYCNVVFPSAQVWLFGREGATAGFIAFRSGWVDQLHVHPDHQRRGIGSDLLAVAQSAEQFLRLWTFQCNLPARRFYESHGFQIERETDGAANEERQPDILYCWSRISNR